MKRTIGLMLILALLLFLCVVAPIAETIKIILFWLLAMALLGAECKVWPEGKMFNAIWVTLTCVFYTLGQLFKIINR